MEPGATSESDRLRDWPIDARRPSRNAMRPFPASALSGNTTGHAPRDHAQSVPIKRSAARTTPSQRPDRRDLQLNGLRADPRRHPEPPRCRLGSRARTRLRQEERDLWGSGEAAVTGALRIHVPNWRTVPLRYAKAIDHTGADFMSMTGRLLDRAFNSHYYCTGSVSEQTVAGHIEDIFPRNPKARALCVGERRAPTLGYPSRVVYVGMDLRGKSCAK
jgi:hypothetical protein